MHYLIRKQSERDKATVLDTEYEADELTLGGQDARVQLQGLPDVLGLTTTGGGRARIVSSQGLLTINGKKTDKANIAVGDTLSAAGYTLSVIQPPAGFDFALSISAPSVSAAALGRATDDYSGWWSIRRISWLLALVVLVPFFVIPLSGVLKPEVASVLRDSPLPDDGLWSSGPLVQAHEISGIGNDCQACHEDPFVMVQDKACLTCHRSITEHIQMEAHPGHELGEIRCASCHREHNEPEQLLRSDNALCVDCHATPEATRLNENSKLAAVENFTLKGHPEFQVGLLQPRGAGGAQEWQVIRERPESRELKETSNLKFDHEIHMDPEKVRDEAHGGALVCADCHTLEDDGEHFSPITMDNNCRSCHALSFDVFEPELELPHGDLRAAIVAMEAHFIREFTDPDLRKQRSSQPLRRVPGKRQAAASCEGSGLACGRTQALKEAEYQFENTGCITCHEVIDTQASDIRDRWFVQPIRITDDWYPFGRFSHSAHLALAWEDEREVCEACHEASTSSSSLDILIPNQGNCLDCHDQEKSESPVTCVGCHAFHQKGASLSSDARLHHGNRSEGSEL